MTTSKTFHVKLDTEGQKLAALEGNAAAFQHAGGAPLMITEHVENGLDAIKQNRKPASEGGTSFAGIGKVDIIIDDDNMEVRIIDNGTGILEPIHVIENPFKSLKTGADYVGHFGRGLHGFRGFCETLEYITLRKEPGARELTEIEPGEDGRCVKITFKRGSAKGDYNVVSSTEFKKYTKSETGTVAILKDWLDFDQFLKNKEKLQNRLQHHFGEEIKTKLVQISISKGKKSEELLPRDFSGMIRFDIPLMTVTNIVTGEEYGQIEFFLYQSSSLYQHDYKRPYLLVQGRPLHNSFLSDMEEFEDETIWASQYITGYIKCDFVEPNQLRVALEPNDKKKKFVEAVRSRAIDIRKLLNQYIDSFMVIKRREENRELVIDIQKFMKKLKIPFNFQNLSVLGKLSTGGKEERENNNNRISSTPGSEGDNEGLITEYGSQEVIIKYEKKEYKKKFIPVPVPPTRGHPGKISKTSVPDNNGRASKVVLIDPDLLSKGGRKVRRPLQGPGLDEEYADLNQDNLSWYEPSRDMVIVNTGHDFYKEIAGKAKKSSSSTSVHSNKLRNYIAERYIWHVIMQCAKDKTQDEKEKLFWNVYHKYFIHKDTT